jgi:DNA-binding transcriptional ArsR family regulator
VRSPLLSPGSVSEHLTVLKANGLLASRRTGRSVLYWQTPLAQSMISTQRSSATLRPDGAIGAND